MNSFANLEVSDSEFVATGGVTESSGREASFDVIYSVGDLDNLTASGTISGLEITESSDFYGNPSRFNACSSLLNEMEVSGGYNVSNVAELQCVENNLNVDYTLSEDIDARSTYYWNEGRGFDPIGDRSYNFSGNFDGDGNQIQNLSIDRVSENNVGLFGFIAQGGTVSDLGIVNSEVEGNEDVALISGWLEHASATIQRSYARGNVTGNSRTGGIAGGSGGEIINSYSAVKASDGGAIVGTQYNLGSVSDSYWNQDLSQEGQMSSDSEFNAEGLSTSEMLGDEASTNMGDFDFTTIWKTQVNPDDYPVHQ